MVRVLTVDDHLSILGMMQAAIEGLEGFEVAGEASYAAEAIEQVRELRPDIVVLDLALGGGDSGLSLIPLIRHAWPAARVVVFSGVLRLPAIRRALAAGAYALVEKTAPLDEFHAAMRAAARGEAYFSQAVSEEIRRIVHGRAGAPHPAIRLSPRDKLLLRAVADGLTSKEIAFRLGTEPHAVMNHRARLMKRAGLHGVAQLARYAVSVGLAAEEVPGAAEIVE